MTLLAQEALPSPPLLSKLLLEDPLILTIALILAAVILFYILNSQAKVKKALLYSGLCLTLSIGVLILAAAIETDREKIIAATTPLVRHTASADTSRLAAMLDPQAKLTNDKHFGADELPHGAPWNKEQILANVESYFTGTIRVKPDSAAIVSIQGIIDSPGRGRTQAQIRVILEPLDFPYLSTWRIDWKQNDKDQWLVTSIQPIDLGLPNRTR